jgi:ParB family chromosome partitioning protein
MKLWMAKLALEEIVLEREGREAERERVESMARHGLLQPLDVRRGEDGVYRLIDGHRRLAATRELKKGTVVCIIEPAEAARCPAALKALLLNTHRRSLQQLHIARRARSLLEETGLSQAELARQLKIGKSTLNAMLRVLASAELVRAVEWDGLEFGAAKALAGLSLLEQRGLLAELRDHAAREGRFPTVRAVEERVRLRQGQAPLPEVAPEQWGAVVEALAARGAPIELKVGRGKQLAVKIEIDLPEAEARWLGEELESAAERRRAA